MLSGDGIDISTNLGTVLGIVWALCVCLSTPVSYFVSSFKANLELLLASVTPVSAVASVSGLFRALYGTFARRDLPATANTTLSGNGPVVGSWNICHVSYPEIK